MIAAVIAGIGVPLQCSLIFIVPTSLFLRA
jgi:hypothetical protein